MKELSTKHYWDNRYSEDSIKNKNKSNLGIKKHFIRIFKKAPWNETLVERHRWVICDRYLPKDNNFRLMEIGCAPGNFLLSYHKRYGYEPWGIDYSHIGVEKTQENFKNYGIKSDNVIEADFFSSVISQKFNNFFDVVTSHGFIEHFDDPENVIKRHVDLLKVGGFLIVSIPNLRCFNYFRVYLTFPEKISLHNLKIMKINIFKTLFSNPKLGLEELYIGYFGTITFRHFFPNWVPDFASMLEKFVWLLVRDRGFETSFFSPQIIYIGRKIH